jgi:hypothetical protein
VEVFEIREAWLPKMYVRIDESRQHRPPLDVDLLPAIEAADGRDRDDAPVGDADVRLVMAARRHDKRIAHNGFN